MGSVGHPQLSGASGSEGTTREAASAVSSAESQGACSRERGGRSTRGWPTAPRPHPAGAPLPPGCSWWFWPSARPLLGLTVGSPGVPATESPNVLLSYELKSRWAGWAFLNMDSTSPCFWSSNCVYSLLTNTFLWLLQ